MPAHVRPRPVRAGPGGGLRPLPVPLLPPGPLPGPGELHDHHGLRPVPDGRHHAAAHRHHHHHGLHLPLGPGGQLRLQGAAVPRVRRGQVHLHGGEPGAHPRRLVQGGAVVHRVQVPLRGVVPRQPGARDAGGGGGQLVLLLHHPGDRRLRLHGHLRGQLRSGQQRRAVRDLRRRGGRGAVLRGPGQRVQEVFQPGLRHHDPGAVDSAHRGGRLRYVQHRPRAANRHFQDPRLLLPGAVHLHLVHPDLVAVAVHERLQVDRHRQPGHL
mmetsp:Transcript_26150/g.56730  ORF Transcript_26150/g.56730 Transcript_26150/m.56730 type:complete len:268 (-) Transcript_26150:1634-2437(-)